jgi:IS605 OrfB family transposase
MRRLRGRERRFQSWVNHNISKALVQDACLLNAAIAFEDLTGIRDSLNELPRNKTERRRTNNWAFYQLRLFTGYKAAIARIPVVFVPPAYRLRPVLGVTILAIEMGSRLSVSIAV